MRHMKPAVLAAAALLICAASASAYTNYSDLRHDYWTIDDAVAAMSSSDIHGSFNRVSAILNRGPIRDLGPGDAVDPGLPPNAESGLLAALSDLETDLGAQLPNLSLEQKYAMLQTVDVVAVGRLLELYEGWEPIFWPCPIGEEGCVGPPRPDVLQAVDGVVTLLMGAVNDIVADCTGTTPPCASLDLAGPTNYDTESYNGWVDYSTGQLSPWATSRATGVESIDD